VAAGGAVIGWVDSLCEDWASHKIRVHGYPEIVKIPGTLGQRLMCTQYKRTSRIGRAAIRSVPTRAIPARLFLEVWTDNALSVARAIEDMPKEKLAVMTVHYLYPVPRNQMRLALVEQLHGKPLSLRTYWRRLHGVHCWIAAKLP
jgi:hypothetical protein